SLLFLFTPPPTPRPSSLPLHDALPIWSGPPDGVPSPVSRWPPTSLPCSRPTSTSQSKASTWTDNLAAFTPGCACPCRPSSSGSRCGAPAQRDSSETCPARSVPQYQPHQLCYLERILPMPELKWTSPRPLKG